MKKLIFPVLVVGVIIVLGGVYALSLYPVRTEVTMPDYANSPDIFGRITGFDAQNNMSSVMFDEALWLTGEDAKDTPNGFQVVDEKAVSTNLFISPDVTVEVVGLSTEEVYSTVSFKTLKAEAEKDFDTFVTRYFILSFDSQGRVSKIFEQYVP